MFDTLLIANRGEIACRIIRTARRMGLRCVAVYSDADRDALHVRMADAALRIGPPPARESYLDIDALLRAARASGAQAVHPGYGFLSENAAFAEACTGAGLVFVGPPASAIRAMGDKAAAKAAMQRAGVPVVPGYHGEIQDGAVLAAEAERIGYPVLIKARAGGGGRGMRVVATPADLGGATDAARREAAAAFGDDRVLIERYLERPRHIEVQVFADAHGACVHLFERDCSVQRRHQKVVEEAPAPGLGAARRAEMGAAAIRAARAVDYVGAGTVEFIVGADGAFHFMEMNTRLQVEHPVTEAITGLDLVEWQLRVAAGAALPWRQDDVRCDGHAIEMRLYAEDPQRDFLPAGGRMLRFDLPETGPHVRIDAGLAVGDRVARDYDAMLAKLIVWDHDRPAALARLRGALATLRVAGATTNLDFLRRIAADPDFAQGGEALDTGFIARKRARLVPPPDPVEDVWLAGAAMALLADRMDAEAGAGPWGKQDGWRLNAPARLRLDLIDGDAIHRIVAQPDAAEGGVWLTLPGGTSLVRPHPAPRGAVAIEVGGRRWSASVTRLDDALLLDDGTRMVRLGLVRAGAETESGADDPGRFAAPMPGRIIAVRVAAGERVRRGQILVVLSAMKMEHAIVAPADGEIVRIAVRPGDQVDEAAPLLVFNPQPA
jgi:3-methylcrotonyl-CoA carboxylase alpha subunit